MTEGSYGAVLVRFSDLWKHLSDAGDEIGWHPHFWRLAKDGSTWFHEVDDEDFQTRMLEESFAAFEADLGFAPTSVRMGWDYHNNRSMQTLARLGVHIDLSALPFQSFAGSYNDRGASFAGCFDWSTSGSLPYRPSRLDYRIPAVSDEISIMELPQNLLQSSFSAFLSEARGAVRDRSPRRLIRALGPNRIVASTTVKACSPPFLFRSMVRDVLRREEDWIATYFHPDELLARKGSLINDLIHRLSYFSTNVRSVVRIAERHGRPVEFVTATEAADLLAHE
ncbi:MAG: hypothetical protein DHS20C21_02290 [Gemmatimonadota bacterium]|nr:MAG: hypothetical protein DHS20C21_02290 [Gemmatimonadota bacterium]